MGCHRCKKLKLICKFSAQKQDKSEIEEDDGSEYEVESESESEEEFVHRNRKRKQREQSVDDLVDKKAKKRKIEKNANRTLTADDDWSEFAKFNEQIHKLYVELESLSFKSLTINDSSHPYFDDKNALSNGYRSIFEYRMENIINCNLV